MAADQSQVSDGLYITVEQYLTLDEATDGKYEYDNGYVFMLRPPSSAYDDYATIDTAGESIALAAVCARMAGILGRALPDSPCRIYSDIRTKLAERRYFYPLAVILEGKQARPTEVFSLLEREASLWNHTD